MKADSILRLQHDPEAARTSAELFREIAAKRGMSLVAIRARISEVETISGCLFMTWVGRKQASTISPIYYPRIVRALDLTDDEIEGLMLCSIREYGPYWTEDGRDTPHDKQHTFAEIAEELGFSRQYIERVERAAISKVHTLLEGPRRSETP